MQVVNSSKLSDGDSMLTGEPLPYHFEPKLSPEGDDISVDISSDLGRMDKAGIVNSAFIVTARRRSVLLEFTHLFSCLLSEVCL